MTVVTITLISRQQQARHTHGASLSTVQLTSHYLFLLACTFTLIMTESSCVCLWTCVWTLLDSGNLSVHLSPAVLTVLAWLYGVGLDPWYSTQLRSSRLHCSLSAAAFPHRTEASFQRKGGILIMIALKSQMRWVEVRDEYLIKFLSQKFCH